MAGIKPLPEAAIVAARLRKMARDLILEAESLEATVKQRPRRKDVKLIDPRGKNAACN